MHPVSCRHCERGLFLGAAVRDRLLPQQHDHSPLVLLAVAPHDLGQLEVVSALAVFTICVILTLSLVASLVSGPGAVVADAQAPVR